MFARVDALLEHVATRLPEPGERRRLRQDAALTLDQVAKVMDASADLVEAWENGLVEPDGAQRAAYARLLDGLHAREQARPQGTTSPAAPASEVPRRTTPPAPATPAPTRSRRTAPAAASRKPATTSAARADEAFPAGPLAVISHDEQLLAHLTDGTAVPCPAVTLADLLHWGLNAGLGQPRLATYGRPADPLLVLTPSAANYLGLPLEINDRAAQQLSAPSPHHTALAAAGWKLTQAGLGPWARIYQTPHDNQRRSIQLAILPWGALTQGGWNPPPDLTPAALATWLGTYAERVLTPRGSTAVCGEALMTVLRPPTRPAANPDPNAPAKRYISGDSPGALWAPLDPAPPEAHDAHPLAQGRTPDQALDEEAWDWTRFPTADETALFPHVVGLDTNMAFVAAATSLSVGLNSPPHYVENPAFDAKTPGSWYCDLTHIPHDPRLPSPFTSTGTPPTQPGWYTTLTLAYAQELGATIQPRAAYLRHDSGRYLDPWYKRLRDAYLATMNDLGVREDLSAGEFLAAMSRLKTADPALLALASAIKATGKGGIGKLREGPRDPRRAPYEPWPALSKPTWRPDIRATVIARARTSMHRKMRRTAEETGLYPLAVLSDCVIYPATRPTALAVVPLTPNGSGISGTFRLGVNPGWMKEEGVQSMDWYQHLLTDDLNPASHIKTHPHTH
ncbi:telomere-associated protein Tap [Streptomyces sp. NPDC058864]